MTVSRVQSLALPAAWLLAAACAGGCGTPADKGASDGVVPPAPAESPVQFTDAAPEAGLTRVTICGDARKNHLLESTGSGVAIADYDGDGDDDVYVGTQQTSEDWKAGRRPNANALYQNRGDGTFAEVAEEAGVALRAWTAGTYFVDYDNDGDKDLFLTTWGPNVLYRNEGNGTFTDVTESAGVAGPDDAWSASAGFGDLDGDGDLDLYVANYCEYDLWNPPYDGTKVVWKGILTYRGPLGFIGQADELYRNDGDGTFTDVTREAGIDDFTNPLYGLGVVMADFDDDSDLDIYVANDSCRNYLWRNDGDLRFSEVGGVAGVATNEDAKEQAGMGTDAGDFDGDGRIDLVVTNFSHDWNTLYRNLGNLVFNDHSFMAGFKDSYLSLAWGAEFLDYDNDGRLDLFIGNGHIYSEVDDHPQLNVTYRERNFLYRNAGDGTFDNVTDSAGPGLEIVEGTRSVAAVDIDRDGDLDVAMSNIDAPPNLLINEGGNEKPWLTVELEGRRSNRDAVGARLTLEAGGRRQVREVNPFGSYQSQGAYAVHFGLGDAERIEGLTVRWPSGEEQAFSDLAVRQRIRIVEGEGIVGE